MGLPIIRFHIHHFYDYEFSVFYPIVNESMSFLKVCCCGFDAAFNLYISEYKVAEKKYPCMCVRAFL